MRLIWDELNRFDSGILQVSRQQLTSEMLRLSAEMASTDSLPFALGGNGQETFDATSLLIVLPVRPLCKRPRPLCQTHDPNNLLHSVYSFRSFGETLGGILQKASSKSL